MIIIYTIKIMAEIVKATELSVLQYVASLSMNPEHVFYQEHSTNNKSLSNVQHTIIAPSPRMMLLDWAEHDLTWTLNKVSQDNAGANIANANFSSGDKISFKEAFPFANSITSITTIMNGATQTIPHPRRFSHQLAMMFGGKNGMKISNSNGGCFWDLDGQYVPANAGATAVNVAKSSNQPYLDESLNENEQAFISMICRNNANAVPAAAAAVCRLVEPVFAPPFNPFGKLKSDMPDYCWYKHMSPVIGNLSRLELDIQMSKFIPSVMYPRVGVQAATADRVVSLSATDLTQAKIKLYWYQLPDKMTIPRELIYQTWGVREFIKDLGVINDDATLLSQSSDLIQLHSIPSLILISGKRNQDAADYLAISQNARDTGANFNRVGDGNRNSMDNYLEITRLELQMGNKNNIINSSMTQEQLYGLTMKNSISKDFPYEFNKWLGRKSFVDSVPQTLNTIDAVLNYPSRCFIALRPKDLGIGMSDGVQTNISFQINAIDFRARAGIPSLFTANYNYRLYVHVFYGKHTLTLTPEAGKFEEQRISLDSSRNVGVGNTGGSLMIRPDDSRYISRVDV